MVGLKEKIGSIYRFKDEEQNPRTWTWTLIVWGTPDRDE